MVSRILAVAFGLAICSLCAAGQAQDPPEEISRSAEPFVVGLEDELSISVYKDPELSRKVKVRPDGKISLPIIQDVEVVGRTPAEIAGILSKKLADYFESDPQVTVIVETINSFRVYFLGEVQKQGPQQFYRPTRVLQAVATAGGPTEYAKKQITIVREDGYGVERRIEIDYKKLLEGAPGQENLYLKPGDTLIFK
jgi:polysaccharide export outer membrane protein